MPRIPRSPFTLPLVLVLVPLIAGLWGCSGGGSGSKKGNLRPFIRITGGPPQGERDSYTARIWWTGWDDDGIIDHYEYTIDPPAVFSPEEIESPEKFLAPDGSLTLTRILGPEKGADTLRFAKIVEGTTHILEYVQTRDFSRSFAFKTPRADSIQTGSQQLPAPTFFGTHTVFVRAQDNDQMYSTVDRLGYTAVTTTPSGFITRPVLGPDFLQVGEQIRFQWDGVDPDSPEAKKKPAGYLYKLVDLSERVPPVNILNVPNPGFIVFKSTPDIPWTYQSAETTETSFFLKAGDSYLFVVRAVDVAGAEEPFVDYLRDGEPGNAVLLQSLGQAGTPELCVTEPSLGTGCYRGNGIVEYEVPAGKRLHFTWQASAESYGGVIEGYNWGINIPDIEKEGPNSGWRDWSTLTHNLDEIVFKKAGINVVYVRSRDTSGAQTVVTIVLRVVEFPLDREILIVDDSKDGTWPRDFEHDAFWMKMLTESGRFEPGDLIPETVLYNNHGAGDVFFTTPVPPKLETFGRYKMVFHDTKGSGYNGVSGLVLSGPIRRHLGAYLGAGGKLWISGTFTMAAMLPTVTGGGDFNYDPPKDIAPGTFPYEFLKIYSDEIRNDKNATNKIHGLYRVDPWEGGPQPFPTMELDWQKMNPSLRERFGVGGCDVVFGGIFEGTNPNFSGQIDSLYTFRTFGKNFATPRRSSPFEGKLAGTRWFDLDPNRDQGRVMWFGFPMYYFKDDQAQETFNKAVDWFREETPPEEF